jgi:tetratricopeptide (TPR) repeat protein
LIDLEYDNMRAALDWSLATPGEARIGYRIAAGLTSHWRRSSLLREGIDWLERALAAIADRDDSEKGLGLAGLSSLWYFRGDLKKAREASDRALASLDDTTDDASRLNVIASACRLDLQSADETERNRGFRLTEQGIALARKLGNRQAEAALSVNLGETLRERGDLAGARQRYEDALSLVQGESVLAMVFNLGQVAVELGDAGRAEEWYRKSHEISRTGDRNIEAYEILGMGQVAAVRSQHVRAVRLLGAAAAAFDKSGERLNTVDQGVLDRTVSACRKALGDEAYDDAWNAGRALEQERALDEAFSAWA